MSAPRMKMPRLLLCVCLLLGGVSSAAPAGSWVAVLRTSSPQDEELVGRVRGQISDLPVVLQVRPGPAPGSTFEAQWKAAESLAHDDSARVVVWFSYLPGEIAVHVADLASQRLLKRSVPADPRQGREGRSASAEATALIVRSTLSALADGLLVGDSVVGKLSPLHHHQAVAPPFPAEQPVFSAPLTLSPSQETPPHWLLSVGWQASLDGQSPSGQQGAQLGLSWEVPRWRAHLLLLASLPAHLSDMYTDVSLSRHTVGVGVEAALLSTSPWRLGAGVGMGVAGFWRRTTALLPEVVPTAPRLKPAFYAGPELSARWRAGLVALEASLALDVLAGVPTFVYQQEEELIVRNRLWSVQPRFGLAMLLELR